MDVMFLNALKSMHVKCVRIHNAQEIFNKMHDEDIDSCNAMDLGYEIHGYREDSLKLFVLYDANTV